MPRHKKRMLKRPHLGIPSQIKRDVFILTIFLIALFSLIAMFGAAGSAGRFMDDVWQNVFGWGWFLWPFILAFTGYLMINRERLDIKAFRWLGLFLFVISYSGIMHLAVRYGGDITTPMEAAKNGMGGGFVGYFISSPLKSFADLWGAMLILIIIFLVSLMLLFEKSLADVIGFFGLRPKKLNLNIFSKKEKSESYEEDVDEEDVGFEEKEISDADNDDVKEEFEKDEESGQLTIEKKKKTKPHIDIPFNLLDGKGGTAAAGDVKGNQSIIQKTFEQFGIDVEMGSVSVGPTVTQYTFKPASGVKVAQITTLSNDLALALAAHPIRIEAPIPGKSLIGIEVPNQKVATVTLREILDSDEFKHRDSSLMMSLGKDVSGKPWVADLARMPHLLVAGATGSGKTVCINSIIVSLLYQNQPDDLKFILVDPKRVEMHQYNNIPHLITPVITDVKKTINALRWSVKEMERRLDVLSNANKRNIASYNASRSKDRMPYIVIIIDELADLMSMAGPEVEAAAIRLAQMARAVGIHLILATQRPSVNVITGLIKANITSRIAFSVASLMDSRTILDTSGAEKLLGRGDMLYITSDLSKPKRIQGSFLSDDEIDNVVSYLKEKGEPEFIEAVTEKSGPGGVSAVGGMGDMDAEDEYFAEAKELVIKTGKASASYLQRKFRIGYARAARLLDLLEDAGIVAAAEGSKPREVLARPEELEADRILEEAEKNEAAEEEEEEEEDEEEEGDYEDFDEEEDEEEEFEEDDEEEELK